MKFSKKLFPSLLCAGLLMSCTQVRSENHLFETIYLGCMMLGVKAYAWCTEHKTVIVGGGLVLSYGLYRMLRKDKEKTPIKLTNNSGSKHKKKETLTSIKKEEALEA